MSILKQNTDKIIPIIIIAYFLYAILFIWNTSYQINGDRYFSLLDDAMISMRYASNLADGYGPYFNHNGAPVEGYTNPLWMLIMSGVHLLPITKNYTSLVIQVLGAVLLSINLLFVAKLTRIITSNNKFIMYGAMLLTALYLPINVWGLGGMETSALITLITASSYFLYKSYSEKKYNIYVILLPAIGSLIRMDFILFMLIFYLLSTSFLKVKDKKFEQNFLILLFLVVFLIFSFRLYFYNEIFPNTYYLKMTGYPLFLRITNGIASVISMGPILLPWLFSLIFNTNKSDHDLYKPIYIIIGIAFLYNIYVGGDAWDWWHGSNRFVTIIMPLILISIMNIVRLKSSNSFFKTIKTSQIKQKYYYIVSVFLILIYINLFNNLDSLAETVLINQPELMGDNKGHTELAVDVEEAIPKNSTVALTTAGVIPYFLDRDIIDILGKNDKHIAKLEARVKDGIEKYWGFSPGHNKWDYSYSIGKLRPDVIVQLWINHEEALPYMSRNYKLINSSGHYIFIRETKN